MTTHPAVSVLSASTYATDVKYVVNIDRQGANRANRAYVLRFGKQDDGSQSVRIYKYAGHRAESLTDGERIARGRTGETSRTTTSRCLPGLRSEPFFFDLDAFKKTVLVANNGRTGCCE